MQKIIRHILTGFLMGVAAFGAVSCQEEPVIPDPTLSMARYSVSSRKGSQFMHVETPGRWTITTEADWIQVIPAKGSGPSKTIALCYDANEADDERFADIVLLAEGQSIVVTLHQNAQSDEPEPDINGGPMTHKRWMELPETRDDDGLNFFWHNMTVGSYYGRNYSFYWDYSSLVSHWVAYPLNAGLRSSGSRSDAWGLDPLIPANKQPTVTSTYRGGWARGHQLPSADRLSFNANVATFYGTNITPQNYDFNGQIWARLEDKVRNWSYKCDTLYVVTGCVVNDKSSWTNDIDGKAVAIPVAYFKAVLSYNRIQEENGGYRGCGVYLPHSTSPSETVARNHSSVMSIRDLEKKLGYNLFVNLPDVVGNDVAAAIETENPNSVNWWWN